MKDHEYRWNESHRLLFYSHCMRIVCASLLAVFVTATASAVETPVWIGSYWSHEIAGITMIEPGQAAVRLRFGDAGLQAKSELYAPDGRINQTTWQTGGAKLTLTWAREGTDGVVGRVASDKPVRIEIAGEIPWRDFRTVYGLTDRGLSAECWGAEHEGTPPPILLPETWEYRHSTNDVALAPTAEPGFKANWHVSPELPGWTPVKHDDQQNPLVKQKGYGWYRTPLTIPRQWQGRVIAFHLGPVAGDSDEWSYLNGQPIKHPMVQGGVYRIHRVWPGTAAYAKINWGGTNLLCTQVRKKGDGPGAVLPMTWPLDEKRQVVAAVFGGPRQWKFASDQKPVERKSGTDGTTASLTYEVTPGQPVRFVASYGSLAGLAVVDDHLAQAEAAYAQERVRASGAFGNFVSIIPEWTRMLSLYGEKPGTLGMPIARTWCTPGGLVMCTWDVMFGSVGMALDDPALARSTVQMNLSEQLPNGMIPGGLRMLEIDGSTVHRDRSQIPVAAMCAWKIHQRWPDKAFLAEVYPKLAKAHDWWFSIRPSNGLPYRDGKRSGLLCYGSELGAFQLMKYESLDDGVAWDDTVPDPQTRTMTLASIELNALWASEAFYLSLMADALNKPGEAKAFREKRDTMAQRINRMMWNEELGMYCSRHWPERPRGSEIPNAWLTLPNGGSGLQGEYFAGTNFETLKVSRVDTNVDFDWQRQNVVWGRPDGIKRPDVALPEVNYSARWTGLIAPPETDDYVFVVAADGGARLWIDGQNVFDDWTSHAPLEGVAEGVGCVPNLGKPIRLEAGKAHSIKLEYKHLEGPAKIHLRWAHWPLRDQELLSPHLAPPNFYPMLAGIPDGEQGKRMVFCLLDEKKFWGTYVCPTISRNNPAFKEQNYWRGFIWPPTNYLLYQGLKAYASDAVRREYVRKCLALFRRHNWPGENYSSDGANSAGPYSWGVLLPLVVLEEICDIEPDGRIRLNGTWDEEISISNVPLLGKKYAVEVKPGRTTLLRDGKVILRAENKVIRETIAQ